MVKVDALPYWDLVDGMEYPATHPVNRAAAGEVKDGCA